MTRVLVTGSTGFIGGALCRALVNQSFQVRAFHRESSNLSLIKELPVEHVIGDLTDSSSIQQAMQEVDVVFHAAAMLGSDQGEAKMYAVTVAGTRSMLEQALAAGVKRFVHTSSVAALGVPLGSGENLSAAEALWMDENHTWNYIPQAWQYGYSKYLAELEVQKAVALGLDAVIVNPSYVIGAGDIYRKSSSVIVQIAQNKLPFLTNGGINVVDVEDVVAGHLAAMQHGKRGERYILAATNIPLVDLIHQISRIVGSVAPKLIIPPSFIRKLAVPLGWLDPILNLPISSETLHLAGMNFYYSHMKAQTDLGFTPTKTLEETINAAYQWFQQAKAI